jgi:BlaI family transcriptional regulator, penicillinase repressor
LCLDGPGKSGPDWAKPEWEAGKLQLTELERKVMSVVWERGGKATVHEILEGWQETDVPGYTTVLKILQILEQKGVVKHRRDGRAYTYIAKVSRTTSARTTIKKVVTEFFGGNRMALACNLIADSKITSEELEAIKKLIADKEKDLNNE